MNIDINLAAASWDAYPSSSVEKRSNDGWRESEGLCKQKVADETDWKLGKCSLHDSNCELGKISHSKGCDDSRVNLDLELKPPCKPQPKFDWSNVDASDQDSDVEIIDLTLSLAGNPVKPEQGHEGMWETVKECDFHDSSFVHMESKPCERVLEPFKITGPNKLVSDKDLNVKFEFDLNSVCINSEDSNNARKSSIKPLQAYKISDEISMELVSQELLTDNNEAGCHDLEQKELNGAKNQSEAERVGFAVSEGIKVAALDGCNSSFYKDACNSSFSKIDSYVLESVEDIKEYREVGGGDTEIKEYEKVIEEVSHDDESETPHVEYGDEEIRKKVKTDGPINQGEQNTTMPPQDVREKHIQNRKECVDKKEHKATLPAYLQRFHLDAPNTTEKRLRKSGSDKYISKDVRGKRVQTPTECTDKREYEVARKAKCCWGAIPDLNKGIAEATEEIMGKQDRGTRSSITRAFAEASEKAKCGIGRWENVKCMYCAGRADVHKTEKEKLNFDSNRSTYKNEKPHQARWIPSFTKKKFVDKSFRNDGYGRNSFRDDKCNDQYRRSDNDRDRVKQFGCRRSDYTWVRKGPGCPDDALRCNRTEDRQIKNTSDYRMPQAHKGRLVTHDLPSSSADHSSFSWPSRQLMQTDNIWRKRSDLPNIAQDTASQQYDFPSLTIRFENPSKTWLPSSRVVEHGKRQSSCQHVHYPCDHHASVPDDAGEISPNACQCTAPPTNFQRDVDHRRLDIHRRQAQEEIFRHPQHFHGGERRSGAEFDEGHHGVEGNLRPRCDHDLQKEIRERRNPGEPERNTRHRPAKTSNEARSAREKAGNSRVHGKNGWCDAESSNARMKRIKY